MMSVKPISSFKSGQKCSATGCFAIQANDFTGGGVCKRCQKVWYCSRKCQTEAWRSQGHKLVCVSVDSAIPPQTKAVGRAAAAVLEQSKIDKPLDAQLKKAGGSQLEPLWKKKGVVSTFLQRNGSEDVALTSNTVIGASGALGSGGTWPARQELLDSILEHILKRHPRAQPLSLISLGSADLLMEFLLAKQLMIEGYNDIEYLFVDPAYKFSSDKDIKGLIKQCKDGLSQVYETRNGSKLADTAIRFLSRAQNACKHIGDRAVIIMESLPPYAKPNSDLVIQGLPQCASQRMIAGGFIVKQSNPIMNSFALLFDHGKHAGKLAEQIRTLPVIPLMVWQGSEGKYHWDCGVKVYADGSYDIQMDGVEENFNSELRDAVRYAFEKYLVQSIGDIKKIDPDRDLSDAEVSKIIKGLGDLEAVKAIQKSRPDQYSVLYGIDYMADRRDMLSGLCLKGLDQIDAVSFKLEVRGNPPGQQPSAGYEIVIERL
ncbi:MAG: zinc finger MYND domain-containing protein [Chlamydiae bacterium]|nr:zinc finger MYND domain-containing protein [Chlamydiota bacterium]